MYSEITEKIRHKMLEKELEVRQGTAEILIQEISLIYPQMILTPSILSQEFEGYIPNMNSYEKKFAFLVHSKGLDVFREPVIEGVLHIPDFFVYNRFCHRGKLVELTLYNRECTNCSNSSKRSKERKRRQIEELQSCGIPFVTMYRENMENIRKYCIPDFF